MRHAVVAPAGLLVHHMLSDLSVSTALRLIGAALLIQLRTWYYLSEHTLGFNTAHPSAILAE